MCMPGKMNWWVPPLKGYKIPRGKGWDWQSLQDTTPLHYRSCSSARSCRHMRY